MAGHYSVRIWLMTEVSIARFASGFPSAKGFPARPESAPSHSMEEGRARVDGLQVDMREMTSLQGLYCVEPPMA